MGMGWEQPAWSLQPFSQGWGQPKRCKMDRCLMPTVPAARAAIKITEAPLPHFQNPIPGLGRQPNPWPFEGPGFSRALLCGCPGAYSPVPRSLCSDQSMKLNVLLVFVSARRWGCGICRGKTPLYARSY